jgi:hypothetical protein
MSLLFFVCNQLWFIGFVKERECFFDKSVVE